MNAYLKNRAQCENAMYQAVERVTKQMIADCLPIVLNDEFGFGYGRSMRAVTCLMETYSKYVRAITGQVDSDYVQEKLDERLVNIMSKAGAEDKFIPFNERYPDIKVVKTAKGR